MADVIVVSCGVCDKVIGLLESLALAENVQEHQRECALPGDYEGLQREFPPTYRQVVRDA